MPSGIQYKCDECELEEVFDNQESLPAGWKQLRWKTESGWSGTFSNVRFFCSMRCLSKWSKERYDKHVGDDREVWYDGKTPY